jgi:cytochrome d ubiquinol oxidase subunit II
MSMDADTLALIWFGLLGVLLAGYAILDGFDLGVGMLHLFVARDDTERRTTLNSIGPLWDGNEVWLVTFGGAMFAAFPQAYATIFSGFYSAFMALLFALIFRAVSIEFRGKMKSRGWRTVWDVGFVLGSFLASLLFGVAVGNVLAGVPVDAMGEYHGALLDQVNGYAVLVGALTVTLFAMHGTIFLYLKTEGELQQRIQRWMWHTFGVFLVFYIFTTMYTLVNVPGAIANLERYPLLWAVPVLNVLAIANIPRAIYLERPGYAFLSSTSTIVAMVFLLGVALFPNVLTSSLDPQHSLTIYNASSSQKTLGIMLIIAVIGMPAVLAYTTAVYWTFRGKVRLDEHSY